MLRTPIFRSLLTSLRLLVATRRLIRTKEITAKTTETDREEPDKNDIPINPDDVTLSLSSWQKIKIAIFAVVPTSRSQLRLRHFVIYICAFLIIFEGQYIYTSRYMLSVREVITASIVLLLGGLVLIYTILDELDRKDPLNAILKKDQDSLAAEGTPPENTA